MYKALTVEEVIECLSDPSNEVDTKLMNIFLYTYRSYCSPLDIIKHVEKRLFVLKENETLSRKYEEREGFSRAVIMFINTWLTLPFAYDFYELPDYKSLNILLKAIREWPNDIYYLKSSFKFVESFKRLEEKINQLLLKFSSFDIMENQSYREIAIDCKFGESFDNCPDIKCEFVHRNFLDHSPNEIALCLTYLDQKVLQSVRLQELLLHVKKQVAPTVTAVIDNYNRLHHVVKTLVTSPRLAHHKFDHQFQYSGQNSPVLPSHSRSNNSSFSSNDPTGMNLFNRTISPPSQINDDSTDRVATIEKWILVCQELYQMRNCSSLVAILTALNSSELRPFMNHFKKQKNSKIYNHYQTLLKIIEPTMNQNKEDILKKQNYSSEDSKFFGSLNTFKLKGKVKQLKMHYPEIPYLGLFLRHLSYIQEGFPDYSSSSDRIYNGNEERAINLDKCRRQFDVLAQVRLCISALSCHQIQLDGAFISWYGLMETECRSRAQSSSSLSSHPQSPTVSVESLESCDSYNSSDDSSIDPNEEFSKVLRAGKKYHSCERLGPSSGRLGPSSGRLGPSSGRLRLDSTSPRGTQQQPAAPQQKLLQRPRGQTEYGGSATSLMSEDKLVTVRLKLQPSPPRAIYGGSSRYPTATLADRIERMGPGTVSGASHPHKRPPLAPVSAVGRTASSISDNHDRRQSVNLINVNYKKIQIYEKDHTVDFLDRVFRKFGKPLLRPSDFDVFQILEKDAEIQIPASTNIYYALAERAEFIIEVRNKLQ